jgi:hypothetical protein
LKHEPLLLAPFAIAALAQENSKRTCPPTTDIFPSILTAAFAIQTERTFSV